MNPEGDAGRQGEEPVLVLSIHFELSFFFGLSGRPKFSLQSLEGSVALKNVSFAYPSRPKHPVASDLSFKVKKGQRVNIAVLF